MPDRSPIVRWREPYGCTVRRARQDIRRAFPTVLRYRKTCVVLWLAFWAGLIHYAAEHSRYPHGLADQAIMTLSAAVVIPALILVGNVLPTSWTVQTFGLARSTGKGNIRWACVRSVRVRPGRDRTLVRLRIAFPFRRRIRPFLLIVPAKAAPAAVPSIVSHVQNHAPTPVAYTG